MKLIPNWQEQNLTCFFCGETKSVKYAVELRARQNARTVIGRLVYACNKCALTFSTQEEEK